ncbi:MAG: hypothetical protein V2A34_11315, partial [Lentisphaerota bacterium]
SASGTTLDHIDHWTGIGTAGGVESTYAHSGDNSLKFYYPGTLAQQDWTAAAGDKYANSGYVFTASSDRLAGDATAVLVMQFLNSTNGVLISYASDLFTATNAADAWTQLSAIGVAPQGTVMGRTLVGLVGTNAGFGGSVYFDDVGQSVVWTDAPIYSLIRNAGFDDNPNGNASDLAQTGDMPGWTWLGGTTAGYISRSYKFNEEQSLAITYPNNLMAQSFIVSGSGNLLANPGFELGSAGGVEALGWYRFGSGGQENNWAAQTGTNGYVLPGWINGGWGGMYQEIAVDNFKGNVYTFSIAGNAETNFTSSAAETYMKIEMWVNGEGVPRRVVTNSIYSALRASVNTWNRYTMTVTNNDGAINLIKPIVGYGNAQDVGGSQACKFDNGEFHQTGATTNNGKSYIVEGYIYNPGTERMAGSAYGAYLLEFYNNGTDLVSVVDAGRFASNSPADTWVKFSVTNRAPWAGEVIGKASAAVLGSGSNFAGAVYFDGISVRMTNIVVTNTQSGQLKNPGFEYSAKGTVLKYIDNWEALGNAGGLDSTYVHSGQNALKLFYTETLIAQTWVATAGYRYACSGYAFTPAEDRLSGNSALQGLVILQYLDATNGVLQSYVSAPFTTNSQAGIWTNLSISGVAPANAVYGRTLVGMIGSGSNYSGSIYFDDLSHSLVSTGATMSGLILNGGFDDGPWGNCSFLNSGGQLPGWKWYGGNNAGFIVPDYSLSPDQSLVMTYPLNPIAQDFAAGSGKVYLVEGYMMTPSEARFDTDGYSYGRLQLSFYTNGSTTAAAAYTKVSAKFTKSIPANTWTYFSVIATSPVSAVVTGRVTCMFNSDNLFSDIRLAGVIYFDSLSVTEVIGGGGGGGSVASRKLLPAVLVARPNDDDDGDGISNQDESIAGTSSSDATSFLAIDAQTFDREGNVTLYWSSQAGRNYTVAHSGSSPDSGYEIMVAGVPATPPQNVFTGTKPEGAVGFFRVSVIERPE